MPRRGCNRRLSASPGEFRLGESGGCAEGVQVAVDAARRDACTAARHGRRARRSTGDEHGGGAARRRREGAGGHPPRRMRPHLPLGRPRSPLRRIAAEERGGRLRVSTAAVVPGEQLRRAAPPQRPRSVAHAPLVSSLPAHPDLARAVRGAAAAGHGFWRQAAGARRESRGRRGRGPSPLLPAPRSVPSCVRCRHPAHGDVCAAHVSGAHADIHCRGRRPHIPGRRR
mmetsp:Transcript_47814/g.95800  ORF Transcript_47814/g.95800 Transcript_47814/m.95800 type:complete len:227 (+) Transcript_47814:990-1670(+)